tara:strand:- start:49 stop:780 length:732 start_codon:yes stop_codon:yes gene_type:complete
MICKSKLDFSKLDNKKLCLLAAEHDEKAFEFLIKNNSEFMMGVCHRFCDSDHEAQEIFQRACIKAWKSFPKFRADCNFKTWIYTIIRSASFDHNRWKKRKAEVSLDSCYGLGSRDQNESGDTEVPKKRGGLSISSSLEWENNKGNKRWGKTLFEMVVDNTKQPDNILQISENNDELSKKLNRALNKLSKEHRECLQYFAEGMSYQEIANCQKVSLGTVMSRLFYARKSAQRYCYGIKNYNQSV